MATQAQLQQALAAAQQAGNAQDVAAIQSAMQQAPSRDQLSQAFYAAKAAGNEADARAIIGHIQQAGMTLAPMSAQQEQAAFQRGNAANVAAMPGWDRFAAGMGKAVVDTGRGVGQLLGIESPQDIQNAQQADAALSNTWQGKVGNLAGQGLMLAMPGTDLFKSAGMLGKAAPYVNAALKMGAFSGAQPVAGGESRLGNTAMGAGLGVAGEALPGALGAAASRLKPVSNSVKQAAIDLAGKYKIPLHLSQVSDSPFLRTLGSVTNTLPLTGAARAGRNQQAAFNRAVTSQFTTPVDSITDDVMSNAKAALGQRYDDIFSRNRVTLDPQARQEIDDALHEASLNFEPDQAQIVANQAQRYLNAADQNGGSIPGTLFQNITQRVGNAESGAATPALGSAIGDIRQAVQNAAERSASPADRGALAETNRAYNSMKIAEKAINKRVAGAGGDVQPSALWSLVNGKYGSTREMRDLARLGQTVLKDPVPNSGTPSRLFAMGALSGSAPFVGHTVLPMAATGAIAGRFLNSPLAAQFVPQIERGLLTGTRGALNAGAYLTQPAPRLLPLFATMPPSAAAITPQQ